MSILFSVCLSDCQSMARVSEGLIDKTQSVGVNITSKIKTGFTFLVESVSNSFHKMSRMFSSSNKGESINSNKKEMNLDVRSSMLRFQNDFDSLKSEMHARLNVCFNKLK